MAKFNTEINSLSQSQYVENKEIVFAIYYMFFNEIIKQTINFDRTAINLYTGFISKIFTLVVESTEWQEEKINAESFMKEFFGLLREIQISDFPTIKEVIDCYDDIDNIQSLNYLNCLSAIEMSFEKKVYYITLIVDYLDNVFRALFKMYGEEKTWSLRNNIKLSMGQLLADCLKNNIELSMTSEILKFQTKSLIDDKVKSQEFDILGFKMDDNEYQLFCEFMDLLDDLEKQIFSLSLPYGIAQISQNDFEKIREICLRLNINKVQYLIKQSTIANKMLKASRKSLDGNHTPLTLIS